MCFCLTCAPVSPTLTFLLRSRFYCATASPALPSHRRACLLWTPFFGAPTSPEVIQKSYFFCAPKSSTLPLLLRSCLLCYPAFLRSYCIGAPTLLASSELLLLLRSSFFCAPFLCKSNVPFQIKHVLPNVTSITLSRIHPPSQSNIHWRRFTPWPKLWRNATQTQFLKTFKLLVIRIQVKWTYSRNNKIYYYGTSSTVFSPQNNRIDFSIKLSPVTV